MDVADLSFSLANEPVHRSRFSFAVVARQQKPTVMPRLQCIRYRSVAYRKEICIRRASAATTGRRRVYFFASERTCTSLMMLVHGCAQKAEIDSNDA
ncbi:hypothetical protein EVAR_16544_1 [Eumeta japonica]|uniref:Uncharacterized protein n=1 Tax=Eumeta variegata TaxID=151549 RepID=A0A4C1U302_EUMVA|nr:hypothetical protein EVAR_16544_1 [Eumeta japonica]